MTAAILAPLLKAIWTGLPAGGSKRPGDSLLAQLLLKASSNDKQFVIEEVQRCLQTMAEAVEPVLCIEHLLPYAAHK